MYSPCLDKEMEDSWLEYLNIVFESFFVFALIIKTTVATNFSLFSDALLYTSMAC
jgi:hypothetical protein